MRVRDLLRNKPATVITVKPHDSLDTAVHLLIANNIGGLPVVDGDGGVAGFLAERDIVRVVHGRREPMNSLRVQDVMRAAPTCDIEDTDRKSTRLNSSHVEISYAVFCLKKKKKTKNKKNLKNKSTQHV